MVSVHLNIDCQKLAIIFHNEDEFSLISQGQTAIISVNDLVIKKHSGTDFLAHFYISTFPRRGISVFKIYIQDPGFQEHFVRRSCSAQITQGRDPLGSKAFQKLKDQEKKQQTSNEKNS